ncbi:MAG: glycosyltransferase [Flavobacteriales bacterium]|nr:glycosyltransferase [Flavobacteriales bacterium]MCB9204527.1 glycosyltransferase [Flavobacteriales bacterium]
MAEKKYKVVINGKLPPPYMGPAIATQVLLDSDLKNRFILIHFDNTINKTIDTQGKAGIGKVFKTIGLYFSFISLLRSEKPDLVLIPISQTTIGFIKDAPYILLAKWFSKRVLIQLRGSNLKTWLKGASGLTRFIFRSTISGTKGVLVLGEKLKYLFEDFYPSDRIFVAPNGGDYSFPERTVSGTELNVLYFANIYKSKGARVALDAALGFDSENVKFTFTGGWRDDQNFKTKFLQDVENAKNIQVNKPTSGEKKFQMFANADIFIFPPIMPEGHPWVLVEAMAAGLPIIATDQGAITESVIDGENGFIVPPGNSKAIEEKLGLLTNNSELRQRMAKASRRLYEEKFTGEQLANNYTRIFNSVIETT